MLEDGVRNPNPNPSPNPKPKPKPKPNPTPRIHASTHPRIHPSIHQSIHPSIHPSMGLGLGLGLRIEGWNADEVPKASVALVGGTWTSSRRGLLDNLVHDTRRHLRYLPAQAAANSRCGCRGSAAGVVLLALGSCCCGRVHPDKEWPKA